MSGSDTSTPAEREAFVALVEGAGGGSLTAAAAAVANSAISLPLPTAFLLQLPAGSTFAQGAAVLQARWAAGVPGV